MLVSFKQFDAILNLHNDCTISGVQESSKSAQVMREKMFFLLPCAGTDPVRYQGKAKCGVLQQLIVMIITTF